MFFVKCAIIIIICKLTRNLYVCCTQTSPKRRSRTSRTKLRRDQALDNVVVEEPFSFQHPNDQQIAGEAAYISATVNNRRYYGVLVDQATMKAASLLHFQQEAAGLDLNKRITALLSSRNDQQKAHNNVASSSDSRGGVRQVQKFRYVLEKKGPGYRILLATFANVAAAAEDDLVKLEHITQACDAGGNFVGDYYYQYEPAGMALAPATDKSSSSGVSVSMGFESFLQFTVFPPWTPPVNLDIGQQAVLNMLQLKKDGRGNLVHDDTASFVQAIPSTFAAASGVTPMEPRPFYRVCVVGAGIAGLSTCLEIFRQCEREKVDIEVTLLEGRDRLGGRLFTDRETFKSNDGTTPFPVDLGASWIHGIDMNPLADVARDAGVDFVVTSEDVKMLQGDMEEVDAVKDKHAGELFDALLDAAADRVWSSGADRRVNKQAAVRWYASVLDDNHKPGEKPPLVGVPEHRQSADLSVDRAIGNAIASQLLSEFEGVGLEERRMLFWNLKNVEYALGANLSDLSMMFWDIDERHAFEGDHVVLRQGYSVVVDYLADQLRQRGQRFKCHEGHPVAKIEYARSTTSLTYIGKTVKRQNMTELSDTCRVISENGELEILCDFVVCAVPLGVLKHSMVAPSQSNDKRLVFDPPLPFPKQDSISNVGFGLLDKVYLQFPFAFWRNDKQGKEEKHTLFGNASGVNPHHYMFLDVGKALHNDEKDDPPAILMSLVSGREAVACEWLSPEDVVQEVMETLRTMFSAIHVPHPTRWKTTKWGSDRFSRGSYTFLGPGTTDADFHILQSPCNGNGDGILLEGSETMRLFFAGEHTTALHPSMAHGAMLSGIRAAREIFAAINLTYEPDNIDRLIPLCLFRHMDPKASLKCALCHGSGSTADEGPLLAFKRGPRLACVHNNCAEASPEVEVSEGTWQNVIQAVNRGSSIECRYCEQTGATIGCQDVRCRHSFHFTCAQKTGWSFEANGKEFLCDNHRDKSGVTSLSGGTLQHALFKRSIEENGDEGDDQDAYDDEASSPDDYPLPLEEEQALSGLYLRTPNLPVDGTSTRLVRMTRATTNDYWELDFNVISIPNTDSFLLTVARSNVDNILNHVAEGDLVRMINGMTLGSHRLDTLQKVMLVLTQEVEIILQVQSQSS